VKFLIDAQLPPALAHWLHEAGHAAQHVYEIGLGEAVDSAIWRHAQTHDQAIITKDEDFAQRAITSASAPIIVWLRVGNATNATLRAWLIRQLPMILRLIAQGRRMIEVR